MNIPIDLDLILKLSQLTFFILGILVFVKIIEAASKVKKTLEKIETLSGISLIAKLINTAICKTKQRKKKDA